MSDLSTGSRRIVDLACQIGIDPKVILFDEPSSGIAQRETEALGPLLVRIREHTGASLLLIEHDMPLITRVSDRIVAWTSVGSSSTAAPRPCLNHPQVVSSYLGVHSRGRSTVRRRPRESSPPSGGGEPMTITDLAAPCARSRRSRTCRERRLVRDSMPLRTRLSIARTSLFWACLFRQRRTMWWLFAFLAVSSVGLALQAVLVLDMVDNAIVAQTAPLWPYVTHIAFWALWSLVFGFVALQLGERLSYSIEFDLRVWLYTHVQSAELRSLDQVASGQLVTRSITDLQLIEQLLRVFPQLVGLAPLLLVLAVYLVILNPIMGILAILALPVNLLLLRRFSKRLRALSWAELNERAEVARSIDEPVRGIRVVKAFGREDREVHRLEQITDRAYTYAMTRWRLLAKYDAFMKIVPMEVNAVLLGVGAWFLSEGRITAGTFLLIFRLSTGLGAIARVFDELSSAWQYLRGAQDRLAEMLALSTRPVTDGRMAPTPSSGLELVDLEVGFGDRQLFHQFSATVAPGTMVVVTGKPGSGKSTLAGIASGLVLPDAGEARLDGLALSDFDPQELRRAVRVVSEEPLLLATTLRENLLLGAWGEISDEQLLEALRLAGAEDVVHDIEGGLDGVVGDRGLTVSGGQRQRISLARALVARPRVLILDDALSAVNPSLEIEIMRRVREALPECSILYITPPAGPHRARRPCRRSAESRAGDVHARRRALRRGSPAGGRCGRGRRRRRRGDGGRGARPRRRSDAPRPPPTPRGCARLDPELAAMVDSLQLDDERVDAGPGRRLPGRARFVPVGCAAVPSRHSSSRSD